MKKPSVQTSTGTPCAWPGCDCEGTFPAPRDPRNLGARQYFCQPHIKEFNKRWNGLEGFSVDEIYQMQDGGATWNRPTWGMGINGQKAHAKSSPFSNAQDLFNFFQQRVATEPNTGKGESPASLLPPDVKEACVIFNIGQPLPAATLKKQYHALVKQHHPDVNKSDQSEEHIKRINVAYQILTDYATRN